MPKWKLQAVEPDTCDGASIGQGCRYIELWDVEVAPALRTHEIVAFDRVCAAHAETMPTDKMKWADGNWKPKAEYIAYQRAWFLRLNHTEWLVNNPNQPMPPQIANLTSDPVTTGSVAAPPQAQIDGMARSGAWNRQHNNRLSLTKLAAIAEKASVDLTLATWTWTGVGDVRVLRVNFNGQLTVQQRTRVQSAADIQFGVGKLVIEG